MPVMISAGSPGVSDVTRALLQHRRTPTDNSKSGSRGSAGVTTVDARPEGGSVSATGGSARSQLYDLRERSWRPRPLASLVIVVIAFAIPVLTSIVVVQIVARVVRRPNDTAGLVVWLVGLIVLATATVLTVDRFSRKLLPIAAVLRLSLVFPDEAPPRFVVALRAGSGKALERALQRSTTEAEFSTSERSAALVVGLISAVSAHDRLTRGHCERVRAYADLIGEELGLDAESRNKLHWAALLHDVGKLEVPSAILNKTEKLTDEEWRIIRGHPAASDKWLDPVRGWLGEWANAASEHHERFDGDGYPNGLRGDQISLAGRIVAVADAFDVMTAARSYKKPYPAAQARVELANNAGSQFDPKVVRAFLAISLGRLRLIIGPLAWLSGLSGLFSIGTVTSGVGAAVTAAVVAVSALAAPAAAGTAKHDARPAGAAASAAGGSTATGSSGDQTWAPGAANAKRPAGGTRTAPGVPDVGDTVPVTPIVDPVTGPGVTTPGSDGVSPAPGPTTPETNPRNTQTTTPGDTTPEDTTPATTPGSTDTTTPGDTTPVTSPDTSPATTPVTAPPVTTPAVTPHAPVAKADVTGTLLNANVAIDVLANDTDVDGNLDPSTLTIVTRPASGYQSITVANGKIDVRVSLLFIGTLVIKYQVCDTTGLCAQATLTARFAL